LLGLNSDVDALLYATRYACAEYYELHGRMILLNFAWIGRCSRWKMEGGIGGGRKRERKEGEFPNWGERELLGGSAEYIDRERQRER
jgi:hypothetical protein